MYRYDEFDAKMVRERAEQFRYQVERRIKGELTEDEFKPLRLKNGLYLQLHSYMLRIAVPYGTLAARQMRQLAFIARKYDRGSGHCVRNVTADHFAGAAADELEDPRPISEIFRQWSSFHPEFNYLPRKFKI